MKRIILLATVALLITVFAGVANAQPALHAPVGPTGHTHHVLTGSGCVDINNVKFEGGDRGLHRGANESGPHGPAHLACP